MGTLPMKILIAEDQPASALLLRRLLERLGHEVIVAGDGVEAWRAIESTRFPIIISDWVMPGLDGLDICRLVRARSHGPYSYLILLTSKEGREERLEGLSAGADDFLVKPPHADELAVRLEIARRILAVQDELERRNRSLADQAHSDELTGVANRRRFREILEVDFKVATEGSLPLSLVMIDVDRFKSYNDTFGHPSGDDLLRRFAATVRDEVRKVGELARYGGEEFAVLLPDTHRRAATDFAERLRATVAATDWPLHPITASFGVATTGPGTDRPDLLVGHADQALYRSKRNGRNQVTHFADPEPLSLDST